MMGVPLMFVVFLFGTLLAKALWAWIIPDMCPEALAQGLVRGSITWFLAAKIALLITLYVIVGVIGVTALLHGNRGDSTQKEGTRGHIP